MAAKNSLRHGDNGYVNVEEYLYTLGEIKSFFL